MNGDKKYQKKVIKLIIDIKKCNLNDLFLFIALCLIRFDNLDKKWNEDSTLFSQVCDLKKELENDSNLVSLLN